MTIRPLFLTLGIALLAAGLASGQEADRFLAGIWPDQLVTFDQETLTFEKVGNLHHGAATNNRWTADGHYLAAVTGRMEAVEVVDTTTMEVVDDFRLSTVGQRIRFMSAVPGPGARRIYLVPVVVDLEPDRFIHKTPSEIWVFDRERREVIHEISLDGASDWRPNIHFSPDGSSLYLVNDHLVELDTETFEETDRVELDQPLAPGYGGVRGHSLAEIEPGRLFGVYRTVEPRQGMELFGVLEIRLPEKTFRQYEVGPQMRLARFALSPDGKRGYAGLSDAAVIDMESREVILRKKGFERGRANISMIVSDDGKRLFVSGVGDTMYVYNAATLERETEIFAGGDFMIPPHPLRYRAPTGN